MTIKKSIGWTNMTLNPIKGKCQGGCWYCWTKPLYKRKFLQPEIRLDLDCFFKLPKKPKRIFLCSTHDLFGSWIPSWWRAAMFERIESNPQHTFQVLTKFPQNIDRPMPDNVWLGVTLTGTERWGGFEELKHFEYKVKSKMKFISYEPLLFDPMIGISFINWMIVGRLTGYGRKNDPPREWIKKIVMSTEINNTPIFLKNNLKPIWGENLIQQFPDSE